MKIKPTKAVYKSKWLNNLILPASGGHTTLHWPHPKCLGQYGVTHSDL